jgi:hypothetical protein
MTGAGDAAKLPRNRKVHIVFAISASCRLLTLPVLRSDPDLLTLPSGSELYPSHTAKRTISAKVDSVRTLGDYGRTMRLGAWVQLSLRQDL